MQFVNKKTANIDPETKYLLEYICQWEKRNPGEEMVFITLPKYDRDERKRVLEAAVKILSEENFAEAENNEDCYGEGEKPPLTPEKKILQNC